MTGKPPATPAQGNTGMTTTTATPVPKKRDALVKDKPAKWGGCATLHPDEPRLWVVEETELANRLVQGFSLAEVIEAGLRLKVVGLSDADRDVAISECVSDALDQLKR